MRPNWPKLHIASLVQKACTLYHFSFSEYYLLPNDNVLKNISDLQCKSFSPEPSLLAYIDKGAIQEEGLTFA